MSAPQAYRYTSQHEWIDLGHDGVAKVGITNFAQCELGDIVFVDLPVVGTVVKQGDSFGNVESVKTVSELYAPVSGTVIAINDDLTNHPEWVNQSPYEAGWMIALQLSDVSQLDSLLEAKQYVERYGE